MFENINMKDYDLRLELQQSYFLRDCLHEIISFTLENRSYSGPNYITFPTEQVIIYKKSDNGITEEINMDELIFYIHTEVADELEPYNENVVITDSYRVNPKNQFYNAFTSIDSIKKSVNNMKIILKYDNDILLTDYWRRNIKRLNLKNNLNPSPKI